MTYRRSVALGALAGALVTGLVGTVAWAAIPGEGGVVQACYRKAGGNLRVIDAARGQRCRAGVEKALSWNQVGRPGLRGPAGEDGEDGADGLDGLDGVDGIDGGDGLDGRTILNGTSDPDASTGESGDFYLNTATSRLFGPKAGTSWGPGVSLVGPPGEDGSPTGPMLTLTPVSVPATACNGSSRGTLYYDADDNGLFYCDGTAYVSVADGTTVPG